MLLSQSALEEWTDEPKTENGQAGAIPVPEPSPSLSCDAVVVGLAPALLDYAHLNTAFRILIGEDRPRNSPTFQGLRDPKFNSNAESQANPRLRPPLIALHKARYLEASDHALSLGPGPFVHALEDAAGASATVVGKPTRGFFEAVLHDLERDLEAARHVSDSDITPRRWEGIAVIGDDVHADLGEGAVELGLWRVLGVSCFLVTTIVSMHRVKSLSSAVSENGQVSPR